MHRRWALGVRVFMVIAVAGLLGACAPGAPASPTAAPTAAKPTTAPAGPAASPAVAASPAASPAAAPSPAVTGSPAALPVASPAASPVASPAASPAAAKPAGGQPAGKTDAVKVAHAPSLLFAPLYLAIDKGYFAEQGIEVQLETVTAGQDAMALAANNQLDVVVAGFGVATFNAIDRGLDLKVVGSMGRQPNSGRPTALMVRKELLDSGQVKEMKDLKGRKIGLAGGMGATGSYLMATKLREGGLTLKDVEVVNLAFPDQVQGLKSGAIDAAIPPAPFTEQIRQDGSADYFGGPFTPGAGSVGTVFGPSLVKDRPGVGQRFMNGLMKAAKDLQGPALKSDANLAIFEKYVRIPTATLRTMDPYDYEPNLKPDLATLTDMQQVFIAEGLLRFASPIPAERYVDESLTR